SQPRTATIDPPAGLSLFYIPRNFRQDTVAMWQLSVQRQIHNSGVAEIAYVGNHGYHLFSGNRNINTPLAPGPGAIDPRRPYFNILPRNQTVNQRNSDGSSSYHGLQFKYSKRFSAGLQRLFPTPGRRRLTTRTCFGRTITGSIAVWARGKRLTFRTSLRRAMFTNCPSARAENSWAPSRARWISSLAAGRSTESPMSAAARR